MSTDWPRGDPRHQPHPTRHALQQDCPYVGPTGARPAALRPRARPHACATPPMYCTLEPASPPMHAATFAVARPCAMARCGWSHCTCPRRLHGTCGRCASNMEGVRAAAASTCDANATREQYRRTRPARPSRRVLKPRPMTTPPVLANATETTNLRPTPSERGRRASGTMAPRQLSRAH